MAEQRSENNGPLEVMMEEEEEEEKGKSIDPELFSCLLQRTSSDSDPEYIGMRRLLLHRKAESGVLRRIDWRCNGKGYVAYRNYIRRPRNWENMQLPSVNSSPGNRYLLLDASAGDGLKPPSPLSLLFDVESWSSSRDLQSGNPASSRRNSFSSTASDNDRSRFSGVEPPDSFAGMHCIFDQSKASVTVLKFAHMSSDPLAYGASDGTLIVCTVSDPPTIIQHMKGHTKDVTDFDFWSNEQYIASSSMDKTLRVWEIPKGLFFPRNIWSFFTNVLNFSTGRIINKTVFDSEVTSMDHDHTGALLRYHRYRISNRQKSPVTTVQYRSFSLLARGPVLLTCTRDGYLSFVRLRILNPFRVIHSIRASFCPLLSLEKGEYVVEGSEDSNVYFYDLTQPRHTCVNKLQGHRFPVMDLAWNHGANLLASSDFYGTVIAWKRPKTG